MILGQKILIERKGTDGDIGKVGQMIAELDGKIDAFGLGGTDLFIQVLGRRYYLRDSLKLAKNAKQTPMVCGAGLKDTLERKVVADLDSRLHWQNKKVLMVLAVDRFGMAEALAQHKADVLYGDLIFGVGLPVPIRSLQTVGRVASCCAYRGTCTY